VARQSKKRTMARQQIDTLVEIVTDPKGAEDALSPEERKAYEEARRSVVEARFQAEPAEGQIRIL
jgi:hypothetical protein